MGSITISYLAVFLAAISSMIVGFLWYSPLLFAKSWMKLIGYTEDNLKIEQKKMGKYYLLSFILALITASSIAYLIALYVQVFNIPKLQSGLVVASLAWCGFVMPVQATATIFSLDKKWKLFAINTGYQLVALLIMGIILAIL